MSQFDYLRAQLADNVWAGKPILTVADAVDQGVTSGKDWYFSLPHIQFIMANPVMAGVKDLLVASQNVGTTVIDCSLVFLETLNGINRAYNSKAFTNLAGKGQQELASLLPSTRERIIYEASVMAYNEALNLPHLSVTIDSIDADIRAIQQGGATAEAQIDTWKSQALTRVEQLKAEILATIESLTGNPRRNARARIRRAEAARIAMTTNTIPNIIAHNPYSISSTYNHSISSIYSRPPVLNTALVPIAVGGAATIAGAVGVLTSIATWLLGSFFLKSFNIPSVLLPALTNTVVSIVLKLSGSSGGAEAVRYLAASALKAGASLLPRLFGTTGMQASGWAYLMSWAAPIIGAAVIITIAMRNKTDLAQYLYVFADIGNATPRKFNLSMAYMSDTNQVEILEQFKDSAKRLIQSAPVPIEKITGVGLNLKKEYVIAYDLTNPDSPVTLPKTEIQTILGSDKVARIASGKFFFAD
ncbi:MULTISPECIES: hypothetical protein [unclassified Microcoleus]|uniref:hypothetical protein n=1 Tax=unclassified Microcoleus TaxID=2642155 RepID=UPI002FCF09D7